MKIDKNDKLDKIIRAPKTLLFYERPGSDIHLKMNCKK